MRAFFYIWNLFSVVVFQRSIVNWRRRYICPRQMCILLYVKLIWCSGIPYICGQLERGRYALSICAFCCMLNVFSVVVFHRSMVNWRGPWYMCFLLSVQLIWCSGIPYICSWSVLSICAFCYVWNLFGVAVFHRSMVNWSGDTSALSICAFCYIWNIFSVVVFHRSMVSGRRGPWYMCILVHVKLLWCSSIPYIYGQLEGYICPKCMCILLYVKLIWCSSNV